MRALVLGGGGQVGRAIAKALPAQHEVVIKKREDLDIADDQALAGILAQAEIDWIVNAAAYTAVDRAEEQPGEAAAVNDAAVAVEPASGPGWPSVTPE